MRLTTRQDLNTPLFRYRIITAVLVVLAGYAVSAFFPHAAFVTLFVLWLFFLPGGDYPMDIVGAATGPMLIAICTGPELAKYSLTFDLGFAVVSSAITGVMGFYISRWVVRDMLRHEPKVANEEPGS